MCYFRQIVARPLCSSLDGMKTIGLLHIDIQYTFNHPTLSILQEQETPWPRNFGLVHPVWGGLGMRLEMCGCGSSIITLYCGVKVSAIPTGSLGQTCNSILPQYVALSAKTACLWEMGGEA